MAFLTSTFQNETLVRRQLDELFGKRDLAVIDADVAPDFRDHDSAGDRPRGAAAWRQWAEEVLAACPDLEVTVEDLIAQGDRVVTRCVLRGTHAGTLLGVAPTGARFELRGVMIWRIANGKLAERWVTIDRLPLAR